MCMLSADELELYFYACCHQREIQNTFSSLELLPFPSVIQALQSLPTYFKGAFFYLAAWTLGIACCRMATSGCLTITLHCPN